ncbi:putative bifunctional diguanylate cyclase/phosphodiesterase [Rhodococcus aerolatus]
MHDPRVAHLVGLVVELAAGGLEPAVAAQAAESLTREVSTLAAELTSMHLELEDRVAERTRLLEDARHQLERLALYDPLTGLANRGLLVDRITHAVARAGRGAEVPAVLVLDLDGFKAVNDGFGHPVGDLLLVEVARRLLGVARGTDTVARLGGDEFAMVLDGSRQGALEVADRVLQALGHPIEVGGHSCWVSTSVGVAYGSAGASAQTLLRDADTAMYAAKARGRGRVEVFEPAMHAAALRRVQVADQLRRGMATGELVVHYQPVVDLGTERVAGVEALVRWQHPERGLVTPGEFIEVAEDGGLVVVLGQWVREVAITQLARWRVGVLDAGPFGLHLNTSPVELRSARFAEGVLACLHRHGVAAVDVVLEITETQLLTEDTQTVSAITALRDAGVGVAIDDFGTGHSSLSYLRRSLVDVVKVDRAVVAGLDTDPRQHRVAAAILGVVDAYGLLSVAEGVQTRGEADQLRDLGCHYGQGWLWGPAVDADTITPLLQTLRM